MNRLPCHVGVCSAFVAAAFARLAVAGAGADEIEETPPTKVPVISASGSCPSLEMIAAAVTALIPYGGVDLLPRSGKVEVSDLGDAYRVGVVANGVPRVRIFQDDGRDCELRARIAAVFIVLTLLPPELLIDSRSKAVPPPPRPPAPRASAPPPVEIGEPFSRRFRLEISAIVDVAPSVFDAPQMVSPGGELRLARRFGRVAGVFSAALEPRASFAIGGLSGRLARIPLDVDVRVQKPLGSLEIGGEVGIAAAIFHADGLNTAMPQEGTRLDVGGRAAIFLRVGRPSARVAPFVGLHALLFPWPYEIAIAPQGTLGSTPAFWVGTTLGVSMSP